MSPRSTLHGSRVDEYPSGYLFFTFAEFRGLAFPHRSAFDDHDLRQELLAQGLPVVQAGFCDWIDDTTAVEVCIGWAWYRCIGDACERLAPGGFSRNVMFTRRDGRSLGARGTERLLHAWLASRPWQGGSAAATNLRELVGRMH